ncbi:MAG: prephenate dehydrogenase [Flavisolibacter sp.]|nr:prephenate dehydrogenase [Flavisolibacter sp.]
MKVSIIGLGLIGGSMAIALKELSIAKTILGVEANEKHALIALEKGLVDEVVSLEEAILKSEFIIIAIPVDEIEKLLPFILDKITKQVVIEVGSIKSGIIEVIKDHPNRKRFVATHPMWGTEYSGPEAAISGAFKGKAVVICDIDKADKDAVEMVKDLYRKLGMQPLYMNADEHDIHVAYVSHISHITSFALANTVLEKEREEDAIFSLASGGFESTVRLAKSNAAMWVPIFMQNRENVLDVLNEHISQLRKFKSCLEKENYNYLQELIEKANRIKNIIK